jgi:RNA-directed DNA polymerase
VSWIVAAQDQGQASCSERRRHLEGRDCVALMSPTQHSGKTFLFDRVTSRAVLESAWIYVRPRLEKSKDAKIRRDASEFGAKTRQSITALQRSLRDRSFKFDPQIGFPKKRKSEFGQPKKDPRPIVIAPGKNRIVQRAILEVCQSEDRAVRRRLGALARVLECQTSVGGLPGRGVPDALIKIRGAIGGGATWFVRSDLKGFFQAVPKSAVEEFLRANVQDAAFNELFMEALKTELENEDEIRKLLHLFPRGDVGVPQGSALSALCANIVLSQFDTDFNSRGITTIRYLDDFVILGKGKRSTEGAFRSAEKLLKKLGFECHDPFNKGSKKAAAGAIENGLQFLSFDISPRRIAPSREARSEFLKDIDEAIDKGMINVDGSGDLARRAQPRYVQAEHLLDKKIRGWGDAFSATTDRLVFSQLDSELDEKLAKFRRWFRRQLENSNAQQKRRLSGIALLSDTPTKSS